jgi:hypothetical protein
MGAENLPSPIGIDLETVQHVANRYTDYATSIMRNPKFWCHPMKFSQQGDLGPGIFPLLRKYGIFVVISFTNYWCHPMKFSQQGDLGPGIFPPLRKYGIFVVISFTGSLVKVVESLLLLCASVLSARELSCFLAFKCVFGGEKNMCC